ncbi:MAG TPA: GNAT family N-acetyltransferase [Planctomycetaceae bacterium]|nr:GNAT family N-acetyltransferase [Planctomycetaceae bacterium]
MSAPIEYQLEPELTVEEFVQILNDSTLAERRPIDDRTRLERMLRNSDIILTAKSAGKLVGLSRAITDFSYCTYLSDLAVSVEYQKQGIGKQLLGKTHEAAGLQTRLILLSAPAAEPYYPHIGLAQHHSCWTIPPV